MKIVLASVATTRAGLGQLLGRAPDGTTDFNQFRDLNLTDLSNVIEQDTVTAAKRRWLLRPPSAAFREKLLGALLTVPGTRS